MGTRIRDETENKQINVNFLPNIGIVMTDEPLTTIQINSEEIPVISEHFLGFEDIKGIQLFKIWLIFDRIKMTSRHLTL